MTDNSGYTLEGLRALQEAYQQGALKVKYQDKEITYDSAKQMKIRINDIKRALGLTDNNKGSNRRVARYTSGL